MGAPLGFIIANSVFLAINSCSPTPTAPGSAPPFLAWGWRVPFLFSAVMVVIGLWVRLRLVESETFVKAEEKGAIRKFPLATVIRHHWWHLILGTFIMLATYVLFYLMTNFTLSYGTKAADLARHRCGRGRRGGRRQAVRRDRVRRPVLSGTRLRLYGLRGDADHRRRVLRHLHAARDPSPTRSVAASRCRG